MNWHLHMRQDTSITQFRSAHTRIDDVDLLGAASRMSPLLLLHPAAGRQSLEFTRFTGQIRSTKTLTMLVL